MELSKLIQILTEVYNRLSKEGRKAKVVVTDNHGEYGDLYNICESNFQCSGFDALITLDTKEITHHVDEESGLTICPGCGNKTLKFANNGVFCRSCFYSAPCT